MRLGLLVGPDRGRYATKVDRMCAGAQWAEGAGFSTFWVRQVPDDFDALTAAALIGASTSRIEVATAVVPVQPRHPVASPQQALSVQAACRGRLTLGLGVSHGWIIEQMLGIAYEHPVCTMRSYLDILDVALGGPGAVDVENELFSVHNPLDITDLVPSAVLLASLGPMMLRLAAERASRTILWLADERAVATHVILHLTRDAEAAGRTSPRVVAGVPVGLCLDEDVERAIERTNRILSEAEVSPNCAAGSESTIEKRLPSYVDARTADFSLRAVPLGAGRDQCLASAERTRSCLASLADAA